MIEFIENLAKAYEQSNRQPEAEAVRREAEDLKPKASGK